MGGDSRKSDTIKRKQKLLLKVYVYTHILF